MDAADKDDAGKKMPAPSLNMGAKKFGRGKKPNLTDATKPLQKMTDMPGAAMGSSALTTAALGQLLGTALPSALGTAGLPSAFNLGGLTPNFLGLLSPLPGAGGMHAIPAVSPMMFPLTSPAVDPALLLPGAGLSALMAMGAGMGGSAPLVSPGFLALGLGLGLGSPLLQLPGTNSNLASSFNTMVQNNTGGGGLKSTFSETENQQAAMAAATQVWQG